MLEAGWLISLLVVLLHFNLASSRIFEPDKVALFRSIALVMAAAWVLRSAFGARFSFRGLAALHPAVHPAVLLSLLLLASYAVSTVFSILPAISLWGYYGRAQGLYTTAAYLLIFLTLMARLRRREQIDRLITTVLLASVAMAVYGVAQSLQLDPFDFGQRVARRVQSTAGNPVFLSATLVMIVPLTLFRLATISRPAAALRRVGYGLVLALQLTCILLTQSRGPVLGLTVGLLFAGLAWTLSRRSWRLAQTMLGGSGALVLLLIVLNLADTPLSFVKQTPYLGRLTRIADAGGSSRGRVLIWQGALELTTAEPKRLATGYGPETIRFAYFPYYSAEIGQIHGWRAYPDRMHNETLDVLATRGLFGLAIYFLLISSLVSHGLRRLGLVGGRRQQRLFWGLWLAGGIGTALLLRVGSGSWAFSGVAVPLGFVGGLFLYLASYAFLPSLRSSAGAEAGTEAGAEADTATASWSWWLSLFTLSGLLIHFVETNVGIAVTSTRLLFWVLAALLLVVGWFFRLEPTPRSPAPKSKSLATARASASRFWGLSGLLLGLALSQLSFAFWLSDAADASGLLAVTWCLAAALIALERPAKGSNLGMLVRFALLSCLPLMLLYGLSTSGLSATGMLAAFYGLVLLCTVGAGIRWLCQDSPRASMAPRGTKMIAGLAALVAIAAAGFLIYSTNLRAIQANILHRTAHESFEGNKYDQAIEQYRTVIANDPGEELYRLEYAQLLTARAAQRSASRERATALFGAAQEVLQQTIESNPYEQYHRAALADLYHSWAKKTTARAVRADRFAQASAAFGEAVRINDSDPQFWSRWAQLYSDMGDRPQAIAAYRRALELETRNPETYRQLGQLYLAEGDWQQAANVLQESLRQQSEPTPEILQGLAIALQKLGRPEDARRQSQRAIDLAPQDPAPRLTLIKILQFQDRCPEAHAQAQDAVRRWPEDRRLAELAAQLSEQCPALAAP